MIHLKSIWDMHFTMKTKRISALLLSFIVLACSPSESEIIEELEYLGFTLNDGIIEQNCRTEQGIGDSILECICDLTESDFTNLQNQIRKNQAWLNITLEFENNIFNYIDDMDEPYSIAYQNAHGIVFEHYEPMNGYNHYIISLNRVEKTMKYLSVNE